MHSRLVGFFNVGLTLYASPGEEIWGLKVETDKPEDLRKALLNNGYSTSVAEKIIDCYVSKLEDF